MTITLYRAEQIAEEIYAILVKHNDAERVLEHTRTSFKHARLSTNKSPIFEEMDQMKTNQSFVVVSPTINIKSEQSMDEIASTITDKLNEQLKRSSSSIYK